MTIESTECESPYFPISLETLKSLFCVNLKKGAYYTDLKKHKPEQSRELGHSIFKSLGMNEFKDIWNTCTQDENYTLSCIAGEDINFFISGTFKQDATHYRFFSSVKIDDPFGSNQQMQENQESIVQSLLIGIDDGIDGNRNFVPELSLVRAVIDDEGKEAFCIPSSPEEFYAHLCYMQQCMAACLANGNIDINRNQLWLATPCVAMARREFNYKIGLPSKEKVIEYYNIQTATYDPEDKNASSHPAPKPMLQ